MKSITNEMSWIGNTEEFASLCEMWLKNKRIGKSDTQVSVRLVRDYVARGILSRPHPKGKEVLFSYEHLVQFLACRYLLEEGYALKRIADDLQTSSLDVILSWIPGEDNDRAMGLIRKFKASEPSIEMSAPRKLSFDTDEDITSDALDSIFEKEKPSLVFHLAAQSSVAISSDKPLLDASTNILGTLKIAENCYKHGVKKLIYSSTGGAIYGEPPELPVDESTAVPPL